MLTFLSTRYFRLVIAGFAYTAILWASFSCGRPLVSQTEKSQIDDIEDINPGDLVKERESEIDTLYKNSLVLSQEDFQYDEIVEDNSSDTLGFGIEKSKQRSLTEDRELQTDTLSNSLVIESSQFDEKAEIELNDSLLLKSEENKQDASLEEGEFQTDTLSADTLVVSQKPSQLDKTGENLNDSLGLDIEEMNPDTLIREQEYQSDTLTADSLSASRKVSSLVDIVEYNSGDSLRFDIKNHKVYLFKKGYVDYGKINLVGDYVEIDFNTNEIFSEGAETEDGKVVGTPVFKDGDQSFESKQLRYNFDTKKGIIYGVKTEEGEGFLLGEKIKKMANDITYLEGGQYTTCDHPDPHYSFRFKRSKVMPGGMIITGPVNFEIEGVPTPLVLPFGLFPGKSGQRSGVIMPTYGQSATQGYYLMNGGYYWGLSEYFDFSLKGSIYTRGSWSVNPNVRYVKKYKYSGSFDFKYGINIIGSEGSPDYNRTRDFRIKWSHNQDAKARPNSKFSGNVNIVTSSFNQFETQNTFENKLSNTFQSSVNYSTNFNKKWFLNVNLGHRQNTLNESFELTLPELSLSGQQIYPFRKKGKVGNLKWYDNISLKYSMTARNSALMPDSVFLQPGMENYFRNGVKHSIPISSSIKLLKYLTWTNSANYTERWYSQTIHKDFMIESTDEDGNVSGSVVIDTISGFKAARDYSLSSSINTRIYGMYTFGNNFPIRAIRHVLTPSVSFSYRPDFGEEQYGYFDEYYDEEQERFIQYSIFEGAIYNAPSSGKSGSVSFNITNNFEMKVRDRNDTLTGTRKVVLIDNLTLSTNYNIAKDSLRWSPLILNARTKLFKDLDVRYAAAFDPYILDLEGNKNLNQYEWTVNRRILRMENASWKLGLNFKLSNDTFKKKDKSQDGDKKQTTKKPVIPWNMNVSYSFSYVSNHNYVAYVLEKDQKVIQTLGFNGTVQLTPSWKISVRSGYDFENKELSYTSLEVYRDLHCWEMHFNWIPLGQWKSWNFGINIKSSMFKDLKLEKKKSHLEN